MRGMCVRALMLCGVAGVSGVARADVSVYVMRVGSLEALSMQMVDPDGPGPQVPVVNPDNRYWIGHVPTAIAYGKGNVFVGGSLTSTAVPLDGDDADGDGNVAEPSPFRVAVVRVGGVLTTDVLSKVAPTRVSVTGNRGYTGMDYRGDVAGGQVVCAFEAASSGTARAVSVIGTVDGVMTASVVNQIGAGTGYNGSCGVAFDFGATGAGFAAIGGRPGIAYLLAGDTGYFGMDPENLSATFSSPLYGPLDLFNPPGDAFGNTQHRDVDVHPMNGLFVSISSGAVRVVGRNLDGSTSARSFSPLGAFNAAASSIGGQHVQILHGFPGGDRVVWNLRASTATGQIFTGAGGVLKMNRLDTGAAESVQLLAPDGSALVLGTGAGEVNPDGNGLYDFAWEEATRTLVILDSNAKKYYVMSVEQPGACCVGTMCFVMNAASCTSSAIGGSVAGQGGTVCGPSVVCQQVTTGRCCVGARCAIVEQVACLGGSGSGAGAVFALGASDCNAGGVLATPCCFADYNKVGGVTVQDVFDFLGDWFNGSVNANVFGDGVATPTVQDVFDYLTAWFAGCA